MTLEKVSLYSKQIRGVSYKKSDLHDNLNENSVILLRANNIFENELNFDKAVYVDKSRVKRVQYLKRGDIVVCASSGSKKLVGKAAQVDFDAEVTFGAFLKVVRPRNIDSEYLGKYFLSDAYRRKISSISEGANINNIRNEHIDDLLLPIVDESIQKKRSVVLDKVSNMLKGKKKQLKEYDQLIKSRFVELFGDMRFDMNFKLVRFSECTLNMLKGPFGSDMKKSLYVPKGIDTYKVYIQKNAIQKNQNLGDYYISKEYFDKKMHRFQLHPKDYIITCDGTLGKFIRLNDNMEKGVISSSLLRLKLKEELISPEYFEYLWDYYLLEQITMRARNACLVHLPSAKVIGAYEVPLPTLLEQNQFGNLVQVIDKLKFEVI